MQFHPTLERFQDIHKRVCNQVVWVTLPADMDTPISAMYKLTRTQPMSFLLESVTGGAQRGQYSIIGYKPDCIWKCVGQTAFLNTQASSLPEEFAAEDLPPLESLRALIKQSQIELPHNLPAMASGLFGYLGYDMVRLCENLPDINEDPLMLEDSIFMRPTVIAIMDHARDTITLITPVWAQRGDGVQSPTHSKDVYDHACKRLQGAINDLACPVPHVEEVTSSQTSETPVSNMTKESYCRAVETAKTYIRAGDIFQVVPSQRWKVPFHLSAFSLYRALRRTNPSPYMTFFNFGHFQIAGASPEILVRLKDEEVTIRPIAGTRPRGETPEIDNANARELLADEKECAEHLMLLDLGRNDVGRVSQLNSVHPTEQFTIERYSHVMHIVSNVVGKIRPDHDALSALLAGLPAGTVSGAPKIRAMEIIDELEPQKRGIYGGAVGYFAANGDMDTCIALRTAVIKDRYIYVQAGGGVVYDSDPEKEYEETVNKAKAIMKAAHEARRFEAAQLLNKN